ncbi:hypothetical protein KEH51_03580 [[Brevibacterium] frigoritolerans]|uniref:Uncharacterized protein n=1 Tax=Peribacillus frigoritolerans TaxID=450367 RepID=A0A941J627_9BACI|nr:hypothetical protein [Peribacillus frigoritolerans]
MIERVFETPAGKASRRPSQVHRHRGDSRTARGKRVCLEGKSTVKF